MEPCYKKGAETKMMYGHRWELCSAESTKSDAMERKKQIEQKGKIARLQRVSHLTPRSHVWLVWWRNP